MPYTCQLVQGVSIFYGFESDEGCICEDSISNIVLNHKKAVRESPVVLTAILKDEACECDDGAELYEKLSLTATRELYVNARVSLLVHMGPHKVNPPGALNFVMEEWPGCCGIDSCHVDLGRGAEKSLPTYGRHVRIKIGNGRPAWFRAKNSFSRNNFYIFVGNASRILAKGATRR